MQFSLSLLSVSEIFFGALERLLEGSLLLRVMSLLDKARETLDLRVGFLEHRLKLAQCLLRDLGGGN